MAASNGTSLAQLRYVVSTNLVKESLPFLAV